MTVREAAEMLAKRAAHRRANPPSLAEKRANSVSGYLSAVGDTIRENPIAGQAILGGLAGAGIGGAGTALGNSGKKPGDRRSVLNSMLTGGIAGVGIGAGTGAVRKALSGDPQGLGHGDALSRGSFKDPTTGRTMAISPQALKESPDLADRVNELSGPGTVPSETANAGVRGVVNTVKNNPMMSGALGAVGAGDLLLNAPGVGLAVRTPQQVGGQVGADLFREGRGDVGMHEDMKTMLDDNPKPGGTRPVPGRPAPPPTSAAAAHATATPPQEGRHVEVLGQSAPKAPGNWWSRLKDKLQNRPAEPGVTDILGRHDFGKNSPGAEPVVKMDYTPVKDVKGVRTVQEPADPLHLPASVVGDAKAKGYAKTDYKGSTLKQLGGKSWAGPKTWAGAVGGRALMYGLPMGAAWLANNYGEDSARQQGIADIIEKLRARGHIRQLPEGE